MERNCGACFHGIRTKKFMDSNPKVKLVTPLSCKNQEEIIECRRFPPQGHLIGMDTNEQGIPYPIYSFVFPKFKESEQGCIGEWKARDEKQ